MTNDSQNTNDIRRLIIKFSALTCPSRTRCTKCVKVQTVHDAYHDMGLRMASCDKCEQTLYHMDVVLHCPPNHRHHSDGYDLCVKCGEIILKIQQKEQQSILRQVAKDKKRKMAERDNSDNIDPNMQPPPKKKRKRGRPRKIPLSTAPVINNNNAPNKQKPNDKRHKKQKKEESHHGIKQTNLIHVNPHISHVPSVPHSQSIPNIPPIDHLNAQKSDRCPTHYRDWEEHLMKPQFMDKYIKYLRTQPHLGENSIKIINRYSSWLDFVRLNEGSEINILNVLCEFENIIAHDAVNHVNAQCLQELNNLGEYLTASDMDYKHIWNNIYTNHTQMNEHSAIAKYASNYMAHNSLHKTLFGDPGDENEATPWKQISQMIEQSHFIRDWKLNLIDNIIQKQIDILQSLIAQNATLKNSLASNSSVLTPVDLRINIWKRHILKLRNIRMRSNVGLEFPMNVLKYDRTQIDHIAKIAAINGIQQCIKDNLTSKPPLPYNPISSSSSLKLQDLLPRNPKPSSLKYNNNNDNNATTNNAVNNTNNSTHYVPPVPVASTAKKSTIKAVNPIQSINGFNHNQQQRTSSFIQFQQPQKHQQQQKQPKPVYSNVANVQKTANIEQLIQNITTNHNIDINQLINVLSNAQTSSMVTAKQNAILQQLTAHLVAKQQQQKQQQVASSFPNTIASLSGHSVGGLPLLHPHNISNVPMLIQQEASEDDTSSIEFLKEVAPSAPVSAANLNSNVNDHKASRRIIGVTPHNVFRICNNPLQGPRMPLNIPKLRPSQNISPLQNIKLPTRNISTSRIDLTNNSPPTLMPDTSKTDPSLEPIIKTADHDSYLGPSSGDSGDTVVNDMEIEPKKEATPRKKTSPEIDTNKLTQVYSDKKYWDKFHSDQKMEHFEWFCNYDDIANILDEHIGNKEAKILEIGCGLSSMASRMVLDSGYKDILCLDWCETAVNKIKSILAEQYKESSKETQLLEDHIRYTVQDIRSMTFERRTFDVVIDKGTLDAIDCGVSLESELEAQATLDGSGKKNLSDNFEEIVAICSRIHEILKPNGLFIIVTSRSIVKRIEFVDELKASHKRHFQKVYADQIDTELKDWRDGDSKTPKLIILKADKNSRKHKHKKTQS